MATSGSFITSKYNSKKWLEFAWERTGYSIADNTSTIKWTLTGRGSSGYHTSGNFKVVIDGETVYSSSTRINLYPGTVVASGTKTIKHNSDGSKSFSASAQAGIYYVAVNCSGSGSWTLNSIPRQANLTAAPNFNDEGNPTISFSNPAGNSVTSLDACISLTGSTDDIAYRAVSKTGSSYTFNLTTAERNVLRNACTTANSRTVKFYLRTVIGGNTYYSTLDKTLTIVNATPTLSPTVVDSNTTMVALTGDSNKLVKYFSDAKFTVGAAALKGASITSVKVTCGNKSSTATSGTLSDVESGTFVFTAKDSRGNSVSKTITKTLISYIKLTCNLSGNNPTPDGAMTFKISGNYFNGSIGSTANTLTVQYRYKENSGSYSSWTTATATKSGNTYSVSISMTGLNYKSTYTFQARATDKVAGTVTTGEKTVRTTPVYDWGKDDFCINVDAYINDGRAYGGCILYDSSSAGTITLSDSIANYDYVDIYFTDNNSRGAGVARLIAPTSSKTVDLSLVEASSATSTYIRRTAYICKGTTLTPNTTTAGYVLISGTSISHTTGSNYILIKQVIGYK